MSTKAERDVATRIVGDACEAAPYRAEWRPYLTSSWMLAGKADDHEAGIEKARAFVKQYGGQARVLAQHVIHVEGLDATGGGS